MKIQQVLELLEYIFFLRFMVCSLVELKNQSNEILAQAKFVIWDWSGTIVNYKRELNLEAFFWIKKFNQNSIPQNLISNAMNTKNLTNHVKALNLFHFFDHILCAGQNYKPKPETEMFYKLLKFYDNSYLDLNRVVYIGDALTDREFAANAKCSFFNSHELGLNSI